MLPFLPPGEEVHTQPVQPETIRAGDVVTFKTSSGRLITHRVVKIVRHQGEIALLTKGDNRLVMDALVLKHQLIAKVTRVGRRHLERPLWRGLGGFIAWISYRQARLYELLSRSGLNRHRHAWERKGWIPRLRLSGGFRMITDPLSWIRRVAALRRTRQVFKIRCVWANRGIRIRTFSPNDLEPLTRVWNESFPSHQTTARRMDQRLCQSPWFDPSGCLLVERAGNLLGWTLGSLRSQTLTPMTTDRRGTIEVLAMRERGSQVQAEQILLHDVMGWLANKGARQFFLGPQWLSHHASGISLNSFLAASLSFGFELRTTYTEIAVAKARFRPPLHQHALGKIVFGPWQKENDQPLLNFLEKQDCLQAYSLYQHYRARSADGNGNLAATLNGRIVGFCRCLRDDQVRDYSDVMWLWSVANPEMPRGYLFHLIVDPKYRGQGIGIQLALKAIESLLKAGCGEIRGVTSGRDGFYRRIGCQRNSRFIVLTRSKEEAA